MTPDARSPQEKRWFSIMLGFSAVAALDFLGMTGMHYWAKGEIGERKAAGQVDAAYSLLQNVGLATLIGQGILMIACIGFFICGARWLIAMKKRRAGGLG
ncbi:hypothetical protein [Luteolibacter soli]|uniref:Uncharacterized protein n=1 Tax=Luteolibacter soli TaxID=3135280 RepID=A0ABU9B271_9BACT